jgi:small-conductance mechanosensitive channel
MIFQKKLYRLSLNKLFSFLLVEEKVTSTGIEVKQVENNKLFWKIFDTSMLIIQLYLIIFGVSIYSSQILVTTFLLLLSILYGSYILWLLFKNNSNYITLGYGLSVAAIFIIIPFSRSLAEGYSTFTFLGTVIPYAFTIVYIFTQCSVPESDIQKNYRQEIEEKNERYPKSILFFSIAYPLTFIIVFAISFI